MDTALVGCPTGSGIQDLYRNALQSDAGEEATAAIDFGNSISNMGSGSNPVNAVNMEGKIKG